MRLGNGEQTLRALGRQIGLSRDKIDEVQMAVVEACITTFEHLGAPAREIDVQFQALDADDQPKGLEVTIRDTRASSSIDKLPRRHTEDNPKGPRNRGHGLRIIDGLMDAVEIQSDAEGTIVVMRKMR